MGEYYHWINIDKREYICPYDFDYGSKYHETMHKDSAPLHALHVLLSNKWKNDHILWMGDEGENLKDSPYEIIRVLDKQTKQFCDSDYRGDVYDMILETYIDVAGLFLEAEEKVRKEIAYYIEDYEKNPRCLNMYGINIDHPFEGLFQEKGRRFKYTINHTKKIAYSLDETRILYSDGMVCDYVDPLPMLLGWGRIADPGAWIGDIVGVADEMPDGYALMKEIRLDWDR